jgi:hypothetical protein
MVSLNDITAEKAALDLHQHSTDRPCIGGIFVGMLQDQQPGFSRMVNRILIGARRCPANQPETAILPQKRSIGGNPGRLPGEDIAD